jgi:hypothetical protein
LTVNRTQQRFAAWITASHFTFIIIPPQLTAKTLGPMLTSYGN